MKRSTPLLALVLALPLSVPLACSDDAIDAGSGGSGSTGTLSTSGTNTGSTGSSTSTNTASGGGDTGSAGGSTTGSSAGGAGGGTGGSGAGGDNTGGSGVGGLQPPTEIAECQGHVYECGDLVDNDGDGLLDNLDPDCLGPCDDTEDSYYGGIPGQAGPPCKVDCYFDQDSGPGNDDCHWDHRCDELSVDPNYYPEPENGSQCEFEGDDHIVNPTGKTCAQLLVDQSEACQDYCAPLVPNGCDCFGCCELPAGSGSFVWLGSEGGLNDDGSTKFCDIENVDNPAVCHPCTPVQDECYNPCGECELCIGKGIEDLPAHCFPGGEGGGDPSGAGGSGAGEPSGSGGNDPSGSGGSSSSGGGSQCPTGVQACGLPGQAPCSGGQYCVTGCCRAVPN